jgi:uncharacterized protein (TIGR02391 family)
MSLTSRFSTYHDLISLEPEELGAVLLMLVQERQKADEHREKQLGPAAQRRPYPDGTSIQDLLSSMAMDSPEWPTNLRSQVTLATHEAWEWLISAGLILAHPGFRPVGGHQRFLLSRRGAKLATEQDVADYRDNGLLPIGLLHPRIATDVRSHFLRKQYDTAVFHAFREVEIALRDAVPGDPKRTGQSVVRDAFNPTTGKLRNTDIEVPDSEREGEFDLFKGAIGTMKNPCSHRRLPLTRGETARLVLFASHLLYLVDERKGSGEP